jgi:GH24 family phage-related lysozyme (muramidase)
LTFQSKWIIIDKKKSDVTTLKLKELVQMKTCRRKWLARWLTACIAVVLGMGMCAGLPVSAATSAELTISQNGIDFIKAREGFSAKCYYDGAQSSIGYGTKCGTKAHASGLHSITKAAAEVAMRQEIVSSYIPNVRRQTSGLQMNQNQFDALVSFTYNTGGGTSMIKNSPLVKYLRGEMSQAAAASAFESYVVTNSATGKVDSALKNRRRLEAKLFFSGVNPNPPTNISIQADRTTITAGESITFTYTIENSTDSCIGIDKDGSRFDTVGISGTSGSISYTFSQPGVYCIITAGSNPYGSACCDGIWIKVNERGAPFNISIQADKTTIIAGESVSFSYTIENSTDSCIGIDKDGSRFDTIGVSGTSGTVSYTFSQPGVYCVITAGSNPYGSACCDGVWIKVNEKTAPFNISIQADRTEIVMGESITFTYTIENSTDSCIGIDKDGSRFDTVNVSGTSGSISYTFSQPGVYCVITAGSNPYGAACCDGVWIKVNSLPGDLNSDNTLTTADAVLLQRYLLQERTLTQTQWQTADLNADGTVNGFDLALLRQKLVA